MIILCAKAEYDQNVPVKSKAKMQHCSANISGVILIVGEVFKAKMLTNSS